MTQYVPLQALKTDLWPVEFLQWYEHYPCPRQGGGLNDWLFLAARHCLRYCVGTKEAAIFLLIPIAAAAGRDKAGEVERQVTCAFELPDQSDHTTIRWPRLDQTRIQEALGKDYKLEFSTDRPPAREIIDALYPGNPLLCVGSSVYEYVTVYKSHLLNQADTQQFIVPNPMSRPTGTTVDGKQSAKSNDNTGPRIYIVIEFDTTPLLQQPPLIAWLARRWAAEFPMVMIVHSGGKSLHAWFGCENKDPLAFFQQAVSMGADRKLWTVSQFVRMPQGRREPKDVFGSPKKQHVIYWNPL